MPPPSTKRVAAGPFSYTAVTEEISRRLKDAERGTRARLAEACGVDAPGFSHRMTEYRGERFSVEQLGAIAAALGAPTPWPFVSWEMAEAFQKFRELVEKAKG